MKQFTAGNIGNSWVLLAATVSIAASLSMLLPFSAIAAEHYILSSASGTDSGSDWNNAMTDLPNRFTRGDTYYVADGNYGGHDFTTPESGSTYIYIKKGTIADHGTDTGWQDSLGDGAAVFTNSSGNTLNWESGYWEFDGQVGGGPLSWKTGYGFVLNTNSCSGDSKIVSIRNGSDNISIRHTEMEHCGMGTEVPSVTDKRQDVFYVVSSDNGGSDNIYIGYCYLHNVNRVMILSNWVNNMLVEYSYFEDRETSGSDPHGQAISANYCGLNANNVYRYNVFEKIDGTSVITPKDSVQSNFYIYGNLFFDCSPSNGIVSNTSRDTNSYMYVFNNTAVDSVGIQQGILWKDSGQYAETNFAYNNLWVNNLNVNIDNSVHDYNAFDDGSMVASESHGQSVDETIFENYLTNDFRLSRNTEPGYPLAAPFNMDMYGNIRGEDGVWDRGAFEYYGEVVRPNPPTNVTTENLQN